MSNMYYEVLKIVNEEFKTKKSFWEWFWIIIYMIFGIIFTLSIMIFSIPNYRLVGFWGIIFGLSGLAGCLVILNKLFSKENRIRHFEKLKKSLTNENIDSLLAPNGKMDIEIEELLNIFSDSKDIKEEIRDASDKLSHLLDVLMKKYGYIPRNIVITDRIRKRISILGIDNEEKLGKLIAEIDENNLIDENNRKGLFNFFSIIGKYTMIVPISFFAGFVAKDSDKLNIQTFFSLIALLFLVFITIMGIAIAIYPEIPYFLSAGKKKREKVKRALLDVCYFNDVTSFLKAMDTLKDT